MPPSQGTRVPDWALTSTTCFGVLDINVPHASYRMTCHTQIRKLVGLFEERLLSYRIA